MFGISHKEGSTVFYHLQITLPQKMGMDQPDKSSKATTRQEAHITLLYYSLAKTEWPEGALRPFNKAKLIFIVYVKICE